MNRRIKQLLKDRRQRRKDRLAAQQLQAENQGYYGYRNRYRRRRLGPVLHNKERSTLIHPLIPDDKEYDKQVSVIFGTYNRLRYLKKCVESIRAACSGISYEIIVSDGGSSDGSIQWLENQPNVKVLKGDLSGAVRAFNQAFGAATGEFILNLNDDAELAPDAVKIGLQHFDDPMVGQVAFTFRLGNDPNFIFDRAHGLTYVNYGLTRASVARAVADMCGGFWAPVYYTYGGDTELSMWVHRLGYRVVEASNARVMDRHASDKLRSRSNRMEGGKSGRIFSGRWPSGECARFRGPLPKLSGPEAQKLAAIEVGESPERRWPRLVRADPKVGELPPRVQPRPERVLHVHLKTEEDPQSSLAEALRSLGSQGYAQVDWLKLSPGQREEEIRRYFVEMLPTLVFIQIQGPHLTPGLIRHIRTGPRDPSLVIAFWCGDVGATNGPWAGLEDGWSHQMAKQADVMLYTGTGQVAKQRARGMTNAAYLQIGYEMPRFFPGAREEYGRDHDIVFLGQNYGQQWNEIPESEPGLRREVAAAFKRNFRRFKLHGTGWGSRVSSVHQSQSGNVYRRSLMSVCTSLTSSLGRYSSDRLFRSMACGTTTLVKRFPDMEGLGLEHGKNVLVWDTVGDAVNLAREWLKPDRRDALLDLGKAGAELVKDHHTWAVRMEELSAILRTLRGHGS